MKIFALIPLLFVATPVEAGWVSEKTSYKKPSASAERAWKPEAGRTQKWRQSRVVGRQGDCPNTRDGYCRSVHDWWEYQNNRN